MLFFVCLIPIYTIIHSYVHVIIVARVMYKKYFLVSIINTSPCIIFLTELDSYYPYTWSVVSILKLYVLFNLTVYSFYLATMFWLLLSFYSDKLRESRSAISPADIANEFNLGVPGEPFSFTQCPNKVRLQDASGLTGEISQLEQFIREYVKP